MTLAYSYNNEEYNEGGFKTIKEALEQALEDNDTEDLVKDGYTFVYVGEEQPYTDSGSSIFWNMIEYFQEQACSEGDYEYCEDYLENISDSNIEWMEKELDNLWDKFKDKLGEKSPFNYIQNIHMYKVYLDGNYEEVSLEV